MLGYTDLADYYKTLWELKYKHKLDINEFYDMFPYERAIYLELSEEYLNKLDKSLSS